MALEKGKKYSIVTGPDYFTLCDSLRYSQRNNNYHNHPAHFRVQAEEGNKSIQFASIVVLNLRMRDAALLEILGVEIELGGFYKSRVEIIYDPEKPETGGGTLQVL